MSFRIDPDRPIRKNVRRLARHQLDRALADLAEPGALGLEETVHDVRKRCKKVRGLIRLVRPGLGAGLTEGRRVAKVRSVVPLGEHRAEVDVFEGALDGLAIVEVEFPSSEAADAFEPPAWFGEEVTGRPEWATPPSPCTGGPSSSDAGPTPRRSPARGCSPSCASPRDTTRSPSLVE
jgi:hypothetical protein